MSRIFPLGAVLVTFSAAAIAQVPASAPVAVPAPGVTADKVKCHRYTETGSLGRVRKECHTVAEWRQIAESGRSDARDMVDRVTNGAGSR